MGRRAVREHTFDAEGVCTSCYMRNDWPGSRYACLGANVKQSSKGSSSKGKTKNKITGSKVKLEEV